MPRRRRRSAPAESRVAVHSAGHPTATILMELGVDRSIIPAIMGHSQDATTESQHADLTMARDAINRLGRSRHGMTSFEALRQTSTAAGLQDPTADAANDSRAWSAASTLVAV
jgi:hypothetical protein